MRLIPPVLDQMAALPGAVARRIESLAAPARPAGSGRRRPVWSTPGRAHVGVRGVHRPGGEEVARALEKALEEVRGVDWAQVNPVLARVMIAFDGDQVDVGDLVDIIDGVEEAHDLDPEEFPPEVLLHPGDPEPLRRAATAIAADVAGVGLGAVAVLLRLPRLPAELAAATGLVEYFPPLRTLLDRTPNLDTALVGASALLQGLGQGRMGLVVDAAHRAGLIGELAARRRAWEGVESTLHPGRRAEDLEPVVPADRPAPLPPGPVESYGRTASVASLAAGGVALAATRDPRRGAHMILAGIPRAARLGREGFAAAAGRRLAQAGVVPMDPRVLRLLDRVDTLVVDGPVLMTGRWTVEAVEAVGPEVDREADLASGVAELFDPIQPTASRTGEAPDGRWALLPVEETTDRSWPRGARTRARRLRHGEVRVLALCDDAAVLALVTYRPEADPGGPLLLAAAERAGVTPVLARPGLGGGGGLAFTREVEGGERLARSVRALQGEGRVVAVASSRPGAPMRSADCGIGVVGRHEGHPPWGADLLCADLVAAAMVVGAMGPARQASRRSVAMAAAGSGLAGLLAFDPTPGSGRRALTAGHLATLASMAAGIWEGSRLARPRRPRPEPVPWHALETEAVVDRLATSSEGLTAEAVAARKPAPPAHRSPALVSVVASELTNPLAVILGAGAGLSAAVGSVADAIMVGGTLGMNALLGGIQRLRTEEAIGRLTAQADAGSMRVVRDATEARVPSADLVPGDVVLVDSGDAVGADVRLLDATGLEADESSLTGESLPTPKDVAAAPLCAPVADRHSMLFAGTAVAAGRGRGVVVASGGDVEARRRVGPEERPPSTGVEVRMRELTARVVPVVLGAGAGLTVNGLLRGQPARGAVASGVSLAAAAVPEGLPFVATAAQAAAARRLSSRGVLVRNPRVLEALGRADVLCFDKTGTLTEGKLRLRRVSDGTEDGDVARLSGHRRLVLAAALRATPRPRGRVLPHPTDQAVVEGAAEAGVTHRDGAPTWRKTASLPFEPGRSYHAVIGTVEDGMLLSVKGAPEVVLPRCSDWRGADGRARPMTADRRAALEDEVERLARAGLRVLAVAERPASARRELDDDRVDRLQLLGFVGVADAARSSAREPLAELAAAGINVVMVTGDHPSTAEAVAAELGLVNGGRIVTGPDLEALDDDRLDDIIDEVSVFARVAPADKVRIVQAFQRRGRVVAMTGDGANDAQAIRLADIGIAFGPAATHAARDAADLIVTDDGVEVLVDAMSEGRAMWASVRDALALLLGGNLGEVAFTTGAALLTGRSPLSARQLLAVNLFTDLAPALAIAVQAPRAGRIDIAREGPETSLGGVLGRDVAVRATATAAGAALAWGGARLTGTPRRARTTALVALVGGQLGQTLVVGHRSPLVLASTAVSIAGLVAVIHTPGLNRFFDCQPLDPLAWGLALTGAGAATAGAAVADRVIRARQPVVPSGGELVTP